MSHLRWIWCERAQLQLFDCSFRYLVMLSFEQGTMIAIRMSEAVLPKTRLLIKFLRES